jgi:hypothetical protein
VLPGRIRKSGKVVGYDQVSRSLIGKRSGKVIRPGKQLGKAGLTRSGMSPGTTRVSVRVKFRITRSGMTRLKFQVATWVRSRAQSRIRIWVSVRVKTQIRRPGKTKCAKQGDLFPS